MQPLPGITQTRFSLIRFRSPLLTESRLFSLPTGTEMFHFPAFPPHTLCVQVWVTPHDWGRVSPFGNSRISARLTAPLDFSQSPTSFIGSWCQDIHRMPLLTCYKDARIHCAVLKEQSDTLTPLRVAYQLQRDGGSTAARARSLKDTKSVFSQDPTAYRSIFSTPQRPFHTASSSTHSLGNRKSSQPASTSEPTQHRGWCGSDRRPRHSLEYNGRCSLERR
jgi:hypothetical protein